MADRNANAELNRLAASIRSLTEQLRSATDGAGNADAALKGHVRTVLEGSNAITSATKALTEMKQRQRIYSQQLSMINSILETSKSEIIKSIAQGKINYDIRSSEIAVTEAEIALSARKSTLFAQEMQSKQTEIDSRNVEIAERMNAIAIIRDSITQNRALITGKESEIAAMQADKLSRETEIAARHGVIQGIQSQIDANQTLIEGYTTQLLATGTITSAEIAAQQLLIDEQDRLRSEISVNAKAVSTESFARLDLIQGLIREGSVLTELESTQELATKALREHGAGVRELNQKNSALGKIQDELEEADKKEVEARNDMVAKLRLQEYDRFAGAMEDAAKVVKSVANALNAIVTEIRKTQQQFGIAAGQAAKLQVGNFISSINSYATSMLSLGKRAGVTGAEILAAQESFQAEFGGVLTSAAATDLARQAKELGVTTTQLAAARRVFMTQTMGDTGKAKEAQSKFIGEFAKKGLTSKDAMAAIGQYSELLARNGTRFAASFARAAADSKKIGVDLSKVDQVGDNIIGDFEGFLEKTAELGGMGFNFDTNKIAQAAESGDTGKLFNELRSELASTGKDITKLRRSEQLALSNAFGISMGELQRMAAAPGKEGSGEELTGVEGTNSFLSRLVSFAEGFGKGLAFIAALLAGSHTVLLSSIAKNTFMARSGVAGEAGGGVVSRIKGWVKGQFGLGPAAGAAGAPTAPAGPAGPVAGPAAPGAPGTSFMSKMDPVKMLAGAAAMVIVASALYVTAKAVQEFMKVDWGSMAKAGVALLGLVGVISGLGAIMSSGVGTVAILAGAAAMVVIAGALWILGKAIQATAAGLVTMGAFFQIITGDMVSNIALLGFAFIPFSAGLVALGVGAVFAAPGLWLISGRLSALAKSADGIKTLADAFPKLTGAIREFNTVDTSKMKDIGKIGAPTVRSVFRNIIDTLVPSKPKPPVAGTSIAGAPTASLAAKSPTVATAGQAETKSPTLINSKEVLATASAGAATAAPPAATPVSTSVNVDMTKLETKLDQVIKAIGSMEIRMDGSKVGKVVVAADQRAASTGVFRTQRL